MLMDVAAYVTGDTMTEHEPKSSLHALMKLERKLTTLGQDTRLQAATPYPFLRVMSGYLAVEYIFAARHDEPHYTWASTSRQHPIDDPAGAARRITADLEQRRTPALRG